MLAHLLRKKEYKVPKGQKALLGAAVEVRNRLVHVPMRIKKKWKGGNLLEALWVEPDVLDAWLSNAAAVSVARCAAMGFTIEGVGLLRR